MLSCTFLRPRRLLPLSAAVCLLAPPSARAQDARKPAPKGEDEEVVRISSDLVQTDVMVFDKQGKFVEGLKPEQFEPRVAGRGRPIIFLERVEAGTVNEDAQLGAARGGGAGAAAGRPAALPLDRGRAVVFFVDDLHLSAGSAARVGKTLLRYIEEEVGQNDEAAVVSASGQVGFLQQFTDNKAVMRAAASRITTHPYAVRDMQRPPMTEVQALAVDRYDPSVTDYFVDALIRDTPGLTRQMAEQMVRERAGTILRQSDDVSLHTLASLYSTVRSSAAQPGRKILFFISDGFVVDERGGATRGWMRRVTDAAARAGVVISSLDAEGLRTGQPDASADVAFDPGGQLASVNMSEVSQMQSPLYTLAADTGGRALVNTNALSRAVSGALKETALYYLLAWKPEAAGGERGAPKYQSIEVSVRGRPDLRVIVRRGFYSAPPPEAPAEKKKKKSEGAEAEKSPEKEKSAAERDLAAALRAQVPRGALPTSLALNFVSAPEGGAALTASVELDCSALTFVQSDKRRATFDVLGVVLDDNGKAVRTFGQQLNVTGAAPAPTAPGARPGDESKIVF